MNTPPLTMSNDSPDPLQPVMASARALNEIVSGTILGMMGIQSEAGMAMLAENLPKPISPLWPDGAIDLLWQLPPLFQAQSRRLVQTTADSLTKLSLGQQQLLEWTCQAVLGSVQNTEHIVSQLNSTLINRRTSAAVISFTDRRASSDDAAANMMDPAARAGRKAGNRAAV